MIGGPAAVLDACVLANFSLCDTLLRLAEPPGLFLPRWSEEILRETIRVLEARLGWPPSLTAHFENELRTHFGEAWVSGFEPLIPRMTNDPKDRHVAAAAAHSHAELIVTFNLRHFSPRDLEPWGVRALHPQSFLSALIQFDRSLVLSKLEQQASDRERSLPELLEILEATVPEFVSLVSETIY